GSLGRDWRRVHANRRPRAAPRVRPRRAGPLADRRSVPLARSRGLRRGVDRDGFATVTGDVAEDRRGATWPDLRLRAHARAAPPPPAVRNGSAGGVGSVPEPRCAELDRRPVGPHAASRFSRLRRDRRHQAAARELLAPAGLAGALSTGTGPTHAGVSIAQQ